MYWKQDARVGVPHPVQCNNSIRNKRLHIYFKATKNQVQKVQLLHLPLEEGDILFLFPRTLMMLQSNG